MYKNFDFCVANWIEFGRNFGACMYIREKQSVPPRLPNTIGIQRSYFQITCCTAIANICWIISSTHIKPAKWFDTKNNSFSFKMRQFQFVCLHAIWLWDGRVRVVLVWSPAGIEIESKCRYQRWRYEKETLAVKLCGRENQVHRCQLQIGEYVVVIVEQLNVIRKVISKRKKNEKKNTDR